MACEKTSTFSIPRIEWTSGFGRGVIRTGVNFASLVRVGRQLSSEAGTSVREAEHGLLLASLLTSSREWAKQWSHDGERERSDGRIICIEPMDGSSESNQWMDHLHRTDGWIICIEPMDGSSASNQWMDHLHRASVRDWRAVWPAEIPSVPVWNRPS
jgi:hypothetical protein